MTVEERATAQAKNDMQYKSPYPINPLDEDWDEEDYIFDISEGE